MDKASFSQALKRERQKRAMTPEFVAERIYVSVTEYNKWEAAEELPPLDTAQKIADVFGISLDTLTTSVYEPKMRMGKEDEISEEEKKRKLDEYEALSVKRYNKGRLLMIIIILLDVISLILSIFTTNILTTVFRIVMLFCLWRGHSWARYVYTALTGIGTVILFVLLGQYFEMHVLLGIFALANVVWGAVVCVLLLANKSIEEFLYEQKTSY